MIEDFSVGAVGAAIIAAVASSLGLIISKEQKTSEFRQAWVDALRAEITKYLTSLNAVADATKVKYVDQAAKIVALNAHYARLNEANFGIVLRLNDKEAKSKAVLNAMDAFYRLAQVEGDLTSANIRPVEAQFLSASKELLKYEWKRVKRGEWTFVVAKWASVVLVLGLMGYAVFASFDSKAERPQALNVEAPKSPAQSIIVPSENAVDAASGSNNAAPRRP